MARHRRLRRKKVGSGFVYANIELDLPAWQEIAGRAKDLREFWSRYDFNDPAIWAGKDNRSPSKTRKPHHHKTKLNAKSVSMISTHAFHHPMHVAYEKQLMEALAEFLIGETGATTEVAG